MDVVNIDKEGDAILVGGPEDQQTGLRVDSKALSRASHVFKALFSKEFKEGAALRDSSTGLVQIPLPDDDLDALKTICYSLHLCHDRIDFAPPSSALLKIAILADKYDVGIALRPTVELWLLKGLEAATEPDYPALLAAAFLLAHPKMYAAVGRKIVTQGTVSSVSRFRTQRGANAPNFVDILLPLAALFDTFHQQLTNVVSAVRTVIETELDEIIELQQEHCERCIKAKSGERA